LCGNLLAYTLLPLQLLLRAEQRSGIKRVVLLQLLLLLLALGYSC
jgi:hypothetical protein